MVIVHGERESGTGKVKQRILFTLYSKAEARDVLGRGEKGGAERLRGLFERQYPEHRLDWKAIRRAIEENLDALPETYENSSQRLHERFREDLCAFTRQLILADPQALISAANLLEEHHFELEYLSDLIDARLALRDQRETPWNTDNPFYWRFTLQGQGVPPDIEEEAAGLFERGDYERAEALFRLLIDCFEGYAEGYNYLGLIALEQRKLDVAIERFQKTIELGRKHFPARVRKASCSSDLATRPYLRGLRNLALSLNEVGRFEEALAICDRLVSECGDEDTARWHRATACLNTRRWKQAADAAERSIGLDPAAGFIAAFAHFERGNREDALRDFLHAALNFPGTARVLLDGTKLSGGSSRSLDETRDHHSAVSLRRGLHAYLKSQSPTSKRFFRELLRDVRISRLLDESAEVARRREEQHPKGGRGAFDRMHLLRSRRFADAEAAKLHDLVEPGGGVHRALIH